LINCAPIGSIVAILVLFIVWASITSVGEVASASGEVTPVGSVKRVQHLEGGIVSAILVRDGDLVQQGQVLMELANGATAPEPKLAPQRNFRRCTADFPQLSAPFQATFRS